MCEPIIDDSERIETEEFTKATVEEYLKARTSFSKFPFRHYSQLEILFDQKTVGELLEKLDIPIAGTTVTVFGGYTGQFAKCLRSLDMNVVFTDPLEEWVQDATVSGFEAYKYSAGQIPRELIKRSDIFATFECYPALAGENFTYRSITTIWGRIAKPCM